MKTKINEVLKNYYILYNKKTCMPYIDRDRRVYVFSTPFLALSQINGRKTLYVKKVTNAFFKTECSYLHSIGVKDLILNRNGLKEELIRIPQNSVVNNYYNDKFVGDLLRFIQDKDKSLMEHIIDYKILIPVKNSMVRFFYKKETIAGETYNIGFLTIDEFNKWNKDGKYKAIEIELIDMTNINDLPLIIKHEKIEFQLSSKDLISIRNQYKKRKADQLAAEKETKKQCT